MPQWTSDQVWQWMLESRGVPEGQHCLRCDGFGVYTYGTTSTIEADMLAYPLPASPQAETKGDE